MEPGVVNDGKGITLTWRNLSVFARLQQRRFLPGGKATHKRIISNATGAVKAGNLVALMGPSGSGKSTLMATLANRNPNNIFVDGDIHVNGVPMGSFLNKISGFMYQEDLFVEALTVREHLRIMAWLKLGKNKTSKDVDDIVKELMDKVGLAASADKRIGVNAHEALLSGGERKKLAFATEMITDPVLFFCDEPTTGLDSYSAQSVVQLMKSMAAQNKTILCTIHQPSSDIFDLFNHLILLFEGRIAFIGSTKEALAYFQDHGYVCPSNYNPADFFIRTLISDISEKSLNRFCDEFAVSGPGREVEALMENAARNAEVTRVRKNLREIPSLTACPVPSLWRLRLKKLRSDTAFNARNEPIWLTKLYWLTYRSFLQVLRDPSIQAVRFLQKLGIAFMAGLCFTGTLLHSQFGIQSVQGAVFLFVTENTFPGMYSVLSLFPQEMPLFLREYRNGFYTSSLYYLSKVVSLVPGLMVDPLAFVLVFYWLAGLRNTLHAFSVTALVAILTANVATACGSFFSNAFESVSVAMACLVPFDYMLMVTSGLFIKLETLPYGLGWFRYLSWFMYANEAMMIAQWEGVRNISCEFANPDIPCMSDGSQVLESFGFSPSHMYGNVTAMILLCAAFHAFAGFLLWRRAKTGK